MPYAAAATVGGFAAFQGFSQQIMGFSAQADAAKPAPPAGALSPTEFKAFKLIEKEKLTGNTYRYRFEMPGGQQSGIFVASCLVTKAMLKEKPEDEKPKAIIRPYTPTSPPSAQGYMDLVVKTYPTGKMSKHFGDLKVGDTLEMKGPIPKYPYQPNIKKHVGMVAGGTGVAPMLQVIDAILSNPEDKTQVSLVFGNVSEDDIILKDRLDALAVKHKNFKVHYMVDKAKWGGVMFNGGVGYITKDVIKQHLPPPGKDNIVMVCGPPGLMESVSGGKAPDFSQGEVKGILKDLGYEASMVYKF